MNRQAYDFTTKEQQYRVYTRDQLVYGLNDAVAARDAMAHHDLSAESWYADDVHTISRELRRRTVQ